jgi:hypothetical protein
MKAASIGRWVIGRRSIFTVESPRNCQEILDRVETELAAVPGDESMIGSLARRSGSVDRDWDGERLLLWVRRGGQQGTSTATVSTVRLIFEPDETGSATLLHIDARYATVTTAAYLAVLAVSVVLVATGRFFGLILLLAAIMGMFVARSREKGDLRTLYDFVADAALAGEPGEPSD